MEGKALGFVLSVPFCKLELDVDLMASYRRAECPDVALSVVVGIGT
jgi:hypothetical protein